jgi:hypothetical protein
MPKPITIPDTKEEYILEDDDSITDKHGTRWTVGSATTASGEGDTYGPGHQNPPSIVKAIREDIRSRE